MLAGVAGGIGRYLEVDPTFVRLAFAAMALFGLGLGVIAYLVMAVVVPEDDGSGDPVTTRPPTWAIVLLAIAAIVILPGPFIGLGDGPWLFGFGAFWLIALAVVGALAYRAWRGRWPGERAEGSTEVASSSSSGEKASSAEGTTAGLTTSSGDGTGQRVLRLLLIVLLAFCAFWVAVGVAGLAAFVAATGNGEIVAGVVVALGIALAGMAVIGEGARRAAPWLLGLALLLALPAGAVAAGDVRFDGGIGQRTYAPVSATDIPADGYELGVGQMNVDLRQIEFKPGQAVELPAKLGVGQLVVSVPSEVCVAGRAEAKGGELLVRGVSNSGMDAQFDRGVPPGAKLPVLEIDADLQFGQLTVTDRGPAEWDDQDPGPGSGQELEPMPEACLG